MMCSNPFMSGAGISKVNVILSSEARAQATPYPCGQCLHCRINQSRVWTNRLLLEQSQHSQSSFVTLTYNDYYIPDGGKLCKYDYQTFLKRLRRKFPSGRLRFYGVGEYGSQTWRPHYHFALFGAGYIHSELIKNSWQDLGEPMGHVKVGDLTKDSARYLTGYITKKPTKDYRNNLGDRPAEFMTCSTKNGGIGYGAIKKIAEQLKKNPHYKGQIIREFRVGKKALPLGRYLIWKLADESGLRPETIELAFRDYQSEIFEEHLTDDGQYHANVINAKSGARLSQEKKQKIYSQRKKL